MDGWRGEAIRETAGVVEELSDRDLVAVGHTRHLSRDVVIEGHLPLPDEPQDEVGRERLGLAGDLELHVRVERRVGRQVGDCLLYTSDAADE